MLCRSERPNRFVRSFRLAIGFGSEKNLCFVVPYAKIQAETVWRRAGMQEPYFWYVLYVKTNTERRVISDITRFVDKRGFPYEFDPFCPESEFYYRNKKDGEPGKRYKKRPLFPGYVFVETTMPQELFLREFGTYVYGSTDIVRILKSGESRIALPEDERRRLEYLLRGKRCFTHSIGVIIGDKVIISDGPLKDFEGIIKHINRHNRYADIELEMFGGKIKAQVALEIVEKRDA